MARSTNIYLALNGSEPVGAFTVKHELATWISRTGIAVTAVRRMPDGLNHQAAAPAKCGTDVSQDPMWWHLLRAA